MSWISDFAGKAEKLLNKIDSNAAMILKNEGQGHNRIQEDTLKGVYSSDEVVEPKLVTFQIFNYLIKLSYNFIVVSIY